MIFTGILCNFYVEWRKSHSRGRWAAGKKVPNLSNELMKPKFVYLYIAFIVSLALLVILSFLFYKKLNSHLKYSKQASEGYAIILELKELEERMIEQENYSRGFMLVKDSSMLPLYRANLDSIESVQKTLKHRLENDSDQLRRFLLMKTVLTNQVNIYNRSIEQAEIADSESVRSSVSRGGALMETFRQEIRQIEKAEVKKGSDLYKAKEFFEDFYPNYFNTISIWAGVITLVSFYFINRELRMRTKYQKELEKKLQELNRSNSELKQFAYIASHDLQEPLRKIRTFSDKLVYRHKNEIDTESKIVIGRIESSAKRMQELIQDMINFIGLVNREDKMGSVNLNRVITKVLADFAEQSKERHAIITWDDLPLIKGSEIQLFLLFKSIFDNAFKFAKPGEPPIIKITYRLVDGSNEEDPHLGSKSFHKIIVEDKGIGFNNEFAEKIFMIFQRLHTQQSGYRGKGIGLAIAQRIMTNHNGVIMARGMINDGATFIMYFPAE